MSDKRCIYTDPRPGDLVQVWPVDSKPPPLLLVTAVDENRIYWSRVSTSGSIARAQWQRTGASATGSGKTLELMYHDPAAVTGDLFEASA